MKAILTDEQAPVFPSMEENSISIATFHKGEEMELGKVVKKKGQSWVEVVLPGDQKGYISGDTKIFIVRLARIMANSTDMMDAPSTSANVLKSLTKGAPITVVFVEKMEDGNWFKICDETGAQGYIPTSVKLRAVQEITRSGAIRNMVAGFIFTAVGVLLTLQYARTEESSNLNVISYAVIFFGVFQLGQGIFEYIRYSKEKKKQQN